LPAISSQASGGTLCHTPAQKPGALQGAAPLNSSSAGPPFTAAKAIGMPKLKATPSTACGIDTWRLA